MSWSEASIFYNQDYVFDGSVSYEHGCAAGKTIACKYRKITAVFASADLIALGLVNSLKENNVEVPDDISIIGFDNISTLKFSLPPLTTVGQDITAKGEAAAEALVNMIEGKGQYESMEKILPLKIIERKSVKRFNNI